jgi:hypothetical protein
MKKKMNNVFLLVMICVGAYIPINTYIKTKSELKCHYNFVIKKIIITPTKSIEVLSENKKIVFWNYTIMQNEGVKVGDKVFKESNSKNLLILRKNNNGINEMFLKKEPNSLFSDF